MERLGFRQLLLSSLPRNFFTICFIGYDCESGDVIFIQIGLSLITVLTGS